MIHTEMEAALDRARAELVRAVEPLTDEQSRRRLVPSLTTPIALVKHCAAAERAWFQRTVAGIEESRCDGYARGDDGGWMVPEGQTLAEVIAELGRHAGHADILVEQILAADSSR